MEESVNKLLEKLLKSPIAFHPIYAEITGSHNAGVLLSQIFYWAGKMHRPFYKTDEEFAGDLVMGLSAFKAAKKKLKKLGFISVERHGVPPKTHYILHKSLVLAQIRNWSKNHQLNGRKSTNQLVENRPNNTKTNTKTTTETTFVSFEIDEELALVFEDARKKAAQYELDLHKILPARTKSERTTYSRLREHLMLLYVDGKKDTFERALTFAKKISLLGCAEHHRAIFIKKCKDVFGYRGQGEKGKIL